MPTNKVIEVVAAVIFDEQGRIFATQLANTHVTLLEHEAAKWLAPDELQSVNWLPADKDFITSLTQEM